MRSALNSLMSVRVAGAVTAIAALGSCTVVTPEGKPDGGTKIIVIPVRPDALPPPKQLTASVLYVANLQRSSANLADAYSRIILGVAGFMQTKGVILENMGLISTYADQFGSRLLLGRKVGAQESSVSLLAALGAAQDAGVTDYMGLLPFIGGALANISDEDFPRALKLLASSGRFDGTNETSEAKGLIEFGQNINSLALPPELGGIDRIRSSITRAISSWSSTCSRCRDAARWAPAPVWCRGRPTELFRATDSDGSASWLAFAGPGITPNRIVHVAIATSEGGTSTPSASGAATYRGSPPTCRRHRPVASSLLRPLTDALNSAHRGTGQMGDFCALVGSDDANRALGRGASFAVGH